MTLSLSLGTFRSSFEAVASGRPTWRTAMTQSLATSDVPEGTVTRADKYAVGNNGDYFAVSRRCRHMGADLATGSIDTDGCLVCPWHHSKYDVRTGRMLRGPQGVFAKIPGLGGAFKALTRVLPLARGTVTKNDSTLQID
ncbi:MAG: Rieske (2Fe-2S) protein [Acidimicrobiales bacterium]